VGRAAAAATAAAATAATAAAAATAAGSAAGSAAWVEAGFSSGTPGTPGRPASIRRTNRTPALRSQPARASPPALCAARLFRADARPSRRLEDTTLLGSVRAPSTAAPLETWRFRRGDAPRAERMGPTARAFGPFAANPRAFALTQATRGTQPERMAEANPTRRCPPRERRSRTGTARARA